MDHIKEEINRFVEAQVQEIFSECKTYCEALEEAKKREYKYQYGELGKIIDDEIRVRIAAKAIRRDIANEEKEQIKGES